MLEERKVYSDGTALEVSVVYFFNNLSVACEPQKIVSVVLEAFRPNFKLRQQCTLKAIVKKMKSRVLLFTLFFSMNWKNRNFKIKELKRISDQYIKCYIETR